jgi:hypothetical protein
MTAVAARLSPPSDVDLPFGPDHPALAALVRDAESAIAAAVQAREPTYIGCVDAGQRGAFGPISLEVMVDDAGRLLLGPFVLPDTQARRLRHLLDLALALLDAPAPRPESGRGIAGWDLKLARGVTEIANGMLAEGEGRP